MLEMTRWPPFPPAPTAVDAAGISVPLCAAASQSSRRSRATARAVGRDLLGHDLGARERKMLVERRPQVFRDAGHRIEPARAAHVEPMPDLLDPHLALGRRHADACERLRQLRARQPHERRLRRRLIALERRLFDEPRAGRRGYRRRNGHGLRFAHHNMLRLSSIDGVPGPTATDCGQSPFNLSISAIAAAGARALAPDII